MQEKKSLTHKSNIRHLAIALIFSILVTAASHMDMLYRLNNIASDILYQSSVATDGTVTIIGINADSLETLGPFQTWDRTLIAQLIDNLNEDPDARPAVIGLDIMYFGETNPQSDAALAQAAARYGNVVVGSNFTFGTEIEEKEDGSYTADTMGVLNLEEPYSLLKDATGQGHVNTMMDEDGIVRTVLNSATAPDGREVLGFGPEIYKSYCQSMNIPEESNPPLNERNQWYLPYSGDPGDFDSGFSVVDILDGTVPGSFFKDGIVLIGFYAAGLTDAYISAIDHSQAMYGVEIHANIIQALLDGNFKTYVPAIYQGALTFVLLLAAYFAFKVLHLKWSLPLMLLLVGGYISVAAWLGHAGYLLKPLYIPLGIALLFFAWLAVNYIREFMEKKRVTDKFKQYVAPEFVDEIIKAGTKELALGGIKREIACLFVDIRGFTPLSESLTPEEVVGLLNENLSLTSRAIFAHGGTLDKYIGDATMAIFNAPLDMDDYIYKSILTAWDMVQGSKELNARLEEKYGRTIGFGVGINCGPAVVGNIGTDIRMDYTAIGDTVNTASGLEGNAKAGQILISESVYQAVEGRVEARCLGEIKIKGRVRTIKAYEVLSLSGGLE